MIILTTRSFYSAVKQSQNWPVVKFTELNEFTYLIFTQAIDFLTLIIIWMADGGSW